MMQRLQCARDISCRAKLSCIMLSLLVQEFGNAFGYVPSR